jgi:hypothetical protein
MTQEVARWSFPGGAVGRRRAACRLVNPDLFFAEAPADVEVAKALCVDCPSVRHAWPVR